MSNHSMKLYYEDGIPFHGIFREIPMPGQAGKEKLSPIYTINEKADSLPSAHEIYMESLTEYAAAMKLVGTWKYWKGMIKSSVRIRKLVNDWREEKLLIDQNKARELMWKAAEGGNASAARFLLESKKEESVQKRAQKQLDEKDASESELIRGSIERLHTLKVV